MAFSINEVVGLACPSRSWLDVQLRECERRKRLRKMLKAMPERNFRSQGTAPLAQLDKRRSAGREVVGSNPSRTNTELWSDILVFSE